MCNVGIARGCYVFQFFDVLFLVIDILTYIIYNVIGDKEIQLFSIAS